jgi:predicted ATPase
VLYEKGGFTFDGLGEEAELEVDEDYQICVRRAGRGSLHPAAGISAGENQMIESLTVRNYRSLADVEVELGALTVLVGPNGSGKSNLVDVLRFVSEALQRGLDAAVIDRHGMSALRRWSGKGRPFNVYIGLRIATDHVRASYSFTLGSRLRGEYRVKQESFSTATFPLLDGPGANYSTFRGEWKEPPPDARPAIPPTGLVLPLLAGSSPFREVYAALTGMGFYNVLPSVLTEPQKPDNPYPLKERGENLASVLRELKRTKRDVARRLEDALTAVMSDIKSYQVSQVGGYLVVKLSHSTSQADRSPLFELSQESEGTLRMLGILAALYQDPPRTLIALEEPELNIHPGAMAVLWEQIVEASGRTQMLMTTHSPDLLDMCRADDLRVVEKIDGATVIAPVAEEQKQVMQRKLFAPGQLLQAQGLRRATDE